VTSKEPDMTPLFWTYLLFIVAGLAWCLTYGLGHW
jgi:hypothetical protein